MMGVLLTKKHPGIRSQDKIVWGWRGAYLVSNAVRAPKHFEVKQPKLAQSLSCKQTTASKVP